MFTFSHWYKGTDDRADDLNSECFGHRLSFRLQKNYENRAVKSLLTASLYCTKFTSKNMCVYHPSAWRFDFLAKNFFGVLTSLAKILAINLGKIRTILQDFSRSWKEILGNSWSSWQQNQEYPRSWQAKQESLASK